MDKNKKRIGILTFHAAHNYGAVLQCYALQEFLEQLGNEVYVIDYRNSKLLAVYDIFRFDRIVKKNPIIMLRNMIKELNLLRKRMLRSRAFNDFINNKLNLCSISNIEDGFFDLIIVGSDQVWNFNLTCGFDKYYWGYFPHPSTCKIASYAASMQDNWDESYNREITNGLGNFDYISVRESSLKSKLEALGSHNDIHCVVDPTLLQDRKVWETIAIAPKIGEEYIFFYQVDPNAKAREIAESLSKRLNLKLVVLSANIANENDLASAAASPAEFLGLIKNASLIITSSFHATIFSIVFQKQFYTVRGKGKNARIDSLLKMMNLEDRVINEVPKEIARIEFLNQDFSGLNKSSREYLNIITSENEQ